MIMILSVTHVATFKPRTSAHLIWRRASNRPSLLCAPSPFEDRESDYTDDAVTGLSVRRRTKTFLFTIRRADYRERVIPGSNRGGRSSLQVCVFATGAGKPA